MSRGLGRVERDVLKTMLERHERREEPWPEKLWFLWDATGHHPESVRRAMKSLARKGFVRLGWDNGWREWGDKFCEAGPTAALSVEYLSTLNQIDDDG